MSAPNILARLQVELNVSSYDDGLQFGFSSLAITGGAL